MVNFHSMPCQLHCCGTHLGCQEVELQLCKPLPRAGPGSQLDVQNHVVYILPVFGSWSLFLHVWLNQPGPMTKWKVRKWICWLAPAMRTQAEVSDRGRIPWMVPQPALGLKTLRIWELLLTHWCRHSCSENLDIFSDKLHLLACSHLILNWSILNIFGTTVFNLGPFWYMVAAQNQVHLDFQTKDISFSPVRMFIGLNQDPERYKINYLGESARTKCNRQYPLALFQTRLQKIPLLPKIGWKSD